MKFIFIIALAFSGLSISCATSRKSSFKSEGQFPYGASGPSSHARDKDRFRTVTNTFNSFQGF